MKKYLIIIFACWHAVVAAASDDAAISSPLGRISIPSDSYDSSRFSAAVDNWSRIQGFEDYQCPGFVGVLMKAEYPLNVGFDPLAMCRALTIVLREKAITLCDLKTALVSAVREINLKFATSIMVRGNRDNSSIAALSVIIGREYIETNGDKSHTVLYAKGEKGFGQASYLPDFDQISEVPLPCESYTLDLPPIPVKRSPVIEWRSS